MSVAEALSERGISYSTLPENLIFHNVRYGQQSIRLDLPAWWARVGVSSLVAVSRATGKYHNTFLKAVPPNHCSGYLSVDDAIIKGIQIYDGPSHMREEIGKLDCLDALPFKCFDIRISVFRDYNIIIHDPPRAMYHTVSSLLGLARHQLLLRSDVGLMLIAMLGQSLHEHPVDRLYQDLFTLVSAFFCVVYDQASAVAHVCAMPDEYHTTDTHTLHNPDGPAIRWRDGTEVYALRGIVNNPTIAHFVSNDWDDGGDGDYMLLRRAVLKERNTEVISAIIAEFGTERFAEVVGTRIIDDDGFGVLLGIENMMHQSRFRIVVVTNSTPEPDGTFKTYWLTVPPHILSAKQAVAWTMGMALNLYDPEKET